MIAPMIDCPACGKEVQHDDYYDVEAGSEWECRCGATLVCTMTEHVIEWEWSLAPEVKP